MLALDELRIEERRRVSLAQIDAIVAARLGPGRVLGNAQPAAFSRQVAMYMASQVGWSTTQIGKFYNGRDHSTVCYAIGRIRARRRTDDRIDRLLIVLAKEIREREQANKEFKTPPTVVDDPRTVGPLLQEEVLEILAERIASGVLLQLTGLQRPTAVRVGGEPKTVEGCAEEAGD